jgi:hypothetical protein
LLGGALLYRRPPVRPYPALDRPRDRDGCLRVVFPLGRFPVPDDRDRVLVSPFEREEAFLERVALLGARVAMISTVPTN